MTKAEIVRSVADSTGEDKKIVADICNAFLFELTLHTPKGGGFLSN